MKLIPLVGKCGIGKYAQVDNEDFNSLVGFKWYFHSCGYAYCKVSRKTTLMHRVILKTNRGHVVDHIDGNRLNNQRTNIRVCSHRENCIYKGPSIRNKSGYKGVVLDPRATPSSPNPWVAYFTLKGKSKNLGCFPTKEEAALAYNKAVLKHHGDFAWTNPVRKGPAP